MFRIAGASLLATLCILFAVPTVAAERYPERPIRFIVPFAPGGGSDITARILAESMSEALGATIVVDNRPGAGSIIGCNIAAKAIPDGYTLLLASISVTVNAAVYKKIPYDVERDLIAITRVSDQPSILVVHPSLSAKTFSDFVALARSQPGKFTFGTPGYGTAAHLASEQLWQKVGADLVQVPFKGTGPALNGLLSKEITIYMSTFASALPFVKQGRLRAYAVTTQKRAGPLPDVPTLAEEGVQDYDYSAWYGLFAPAGTPQTIVNMVHKAAVDSLKSPKLLQTFENEGMNATPTTPEQFASYIASERSKWSDVMQFAKIEQR
jgi:tripartite-type tricarboxylate transporter receptor subunit TctC